jgi:hypothetical protein
MAGSKVEHEIENEAGLQRTLKDLFAGAVGGVAQVLLGMWVACFVRLVVWLVVFDANGPMCRVYMYIC